MSETTFQGSKSYALDIAAFSWLRTDAGNAASWVIDFNENLLGKKLLRSDVMKVLYWYGSQVEAGNIKAFKGESDPQAKNISEATALSSGLDVDFCYNVLYALWSGAQLQKKGCAQTLKGNAVTVVNVAEMESPVKAVVSTVKKTVAQGLEALGLPAVLSEAGTVLIAVVVFAALVYIYANKRK